MLIFRRYINEEQAKLSSKGVAAIQHVKSEEEEHRACIRINDAWNAEIAKVRDERLLAGRAAIKEKALQDLIQFEEKQKQVLESAEAIVKSEKVSDVTAQTSIMHSCVFEHSKKFLVSPVDVSRDQ